jgi:UrcA family protein
MAVRVVDSYYRPVSLCKGEGLKCYKPFDLPMTLVMGPPHDERHCRARALHEKKWLIGSERLARIHHQEIAMKTPIKTRFQSAASVIAMVTIACAVISGSAAATEPGNGLTRAVAYGDLNLASEQGAKALYGRLRFAAQQVCASLENPDLSQQKVRQNCVDSALESAVSKINNPLVSALQDQRVNRGTKS